MSFYRRSGNKYGAKKTVVDGHTFDSKAEANYYVELKLRVRAGELKSFARQPEFTLIESFTYKGKKIRATKYRADFLLEHASGEWEIVDVKGVSTPTFKLKWKLLQSQYRDKPHKLTIIDAKDYK